MTRLLEYLFGRRTSEKSYLATSRQSGIEKLQRRHQLPAAGHTCDDIYAAGPDAP
jgi:hypothetical protein